MYTVWTGKKFKGSWGSKELALRYMAARDPAEREAWTLVTVDLDTGLDGEVEAMVEQVAAESAAKHAGTMHHLKASDIEVVSGSTLGKVN